MEPRINIVTLGVADLERSVRFYRDCIGFPTNYRDGESIAFFSTNGARLALYPLDRLAEDISPSLHPQKSQFSGITLGHNTRSKEDVSAILERAEAGGGTIVKHAQDVFWGGHSGYFTDPDGHFWEVAWAPMFKFAPDGSLLIDP